MAVRKSGGNYQYNINTRYGNPLSGSDLSNRMSGTDANAIYYATHGGSMSGKATPGKVEVVPTNKKDPTPTGKSQENVTEPINSGGGGYSGYDYAGMIESMLAEQRAAAQRAYDVSKGRLDEAWGNTQKALGDNLARALEDLQRNYNYGSGVHRQDAKDSLRQAYINYMLNKRDLNQNLKALGLSGGATESSMAEMYNNYGNAKNSINQQLSRNIAELLNNYQNNTSSAEQLFNTQFADANNNYVNQLNQLEQLLANNMMSSYSGSSLASLASYASALSDLQNQMAADTANYTPVQNNYARNTVSTSMGNDTGSVTDYAKYRNMYDDMMAQGQTASNIITQLKNAGAPRDLVYELMGV